MNTALILVTRAASFAAHRHSDQRRKGERAEPYVNHLAEVAALLAEATNGEDANLIAAGYLHDTVEDQGVLKEELTLEFNEDVANLVLHVTDDKGLPRDVRKRQQVEHAPHLPRRAQMLKIADKCSNLKAILQSPPPWPVERKLAYFDWASQVVDGCRGANAQLEATFDALLARRGELV